MASRLTEKILKLPRVIASKLGIGDEQLIDELESDGYLALLQADKSFDPSKHPKGEEGFTNFAYQWIKLRLIGNLKEHRTTLSLEELGHEVVARDDPLTDAQNKELAREALSKLDPIDRLIYTWIEVEEHSCYWVSDRLGNYLTRSGVRDRFYKLERDLKNNKERKSTNVSSVRFHLEKKLSGKIPSSSEHWCLVNDEKQTISNSTEGLRNLLEKLGFAIPESVNSQSLKRYADSLADSKRLQGGRIARGKEGAKLATENGYVYVLTREEAAKAKISRKRK